MRSCLCCLVLLSALVGNADAQELPRVKVGSKIFSESFVLGEIVAQLLESRGYRVERKLGLGGTLIAYEALKLGELDVYPEYSGTLVRAVLKQEQLSRQALDKALGEEGLIFHARLGFDNSYAIAVSDDIAQALALTTISDLARHPRLRIGFSHEFLNRGDGWPALQARYELPQQPSGIEHALAYRAIDEDQLDATDAYTTDGDLDRYALSLLKDDRGLFPVYDAGLLARADLQTEVLQILGELEGRIDESTMRQLNRRVADDGQSPELVARAFLAELGLLDAKSAAASEAASADRRDSRLLHNVLRHLKLTALALLLGCLVAIPLALLASQSPRVSSSLQYVAGLVQTVPALALLALFIPVLGLGEATAIAALFLYSLLPIVRNTLTGLAGIDPMHREVAAGMGLTASQQMRHIELPLAMPMILAGIKTAAVISIGTATLAAFVGAGGLGEPIITGIALNDHGLILQGAIPAAGLAMVVEFLFELLERRLIPAHLRVR